MVMWVWNVTRFYQSRDGGAGKETSGSTERLVFCSVSGVGSGISGKSGPLRFLSIRTVIFLSTKCMMALRAITEYGKREGFDSGS